MQLILADWVFGYGSLIWSPEISYEHAEIGRLQGYQRAFCIRSTRYRGTPENPGVVLGLDPGGSCTGLAFRLRPHERRAAIQKLYDREMRNRVYAPSIVPVHLESGGTIEALTFVANRESDAYERLDESQLLRRLTGCCGERGPNVDYLVKTHQSLQERGIQDGLLARLIDRLASLQSA